MNGVLIADKPRGFTSFDLCAKLRGVLKEKRIGHAGTLDPMATGVMVIMLGKATRACELLPESDKGYIAGFRLGERTDTLDTSGTIIEKSPLRPGKSELEAALCDFRGELEQLPPMYSAVHVDGKRLYQLAREGKQAVRKPRRVNIIKLELLSFDEESGEGVLEVLCSKGTYIRALTDDIGQRLGCGAVLCSLRRTMACGFSIERAHSLEELVALGAEAQRLLLPVEELFTVYPAICVSPAQTVRYINGGELDTQRLSVDFATEENMLVRVYGADGFIGVGKLDAGAKCLRPHKRFC